MIVTINNCIFNFNSVKFFRYLDSCFKMLPNFGRLIAQI